MATKETWQNLILGCSMSLSSVSPYPRWCPCFSNSPLGRLPHSHRSSYWHAVGITADYSIPWSGTAEVSALPGRLMPMSTEALQLIRKGNPQLESWSGEDDLGSKRNICVRAWLSPFEPTVFMAQCCIVLRESFLLFRVSENMVSPLKPKVFLGVSGVHRPGWWLGFLGFFLCLFPHPPLSLSAF